MDNSQNTKTRRENRFLEAGIWLLFFALLVPAGFVGYEIGRTTMAPPAHYATHVQ
jgi:hypothetical protein